MTSVAIKTFSKDDVIDGDKIKFNTLNIYDKRPDDYFEMSSKFSTKLWIDILHPNKAKILTIDKNNVKWMLRAKDIDSFRDGWYGSFRDEYLAMCKKYRPILLELLGSYKPWFLRTEQYSLKLSGYFGPITGNDIEKVIKGLVKFVRGHSGMESYLDENKEKTIYFLPWLPIDEDREFRLFIKNNRLVAISQQHLYQINNWLTNLSIDEIHKIIDKIVYHFTSQIRDKLLHFSDYILDFVFLDNTLDSPYFIELNQFGQEYGAGSALFEWIADHDLLYGCKSTIEFRFVNA